MFKNDPDKSIEMLASGGAAVLANDGAATGCVEVAEAGASDANTSKPLDEKSDNRGYGNVSVGVGDEGLPDPEVYEAARRIDEERWFYRFVKRAFDIVFSAAVILSLLLPSAILCIAIRLESPGCPIYSQKRVGRIGQNGEVRTFDMYKFRSMYADADERLPELAHMNEADGPLFKIKDDPRVDLRIIETNTRRPLSALVFASVFPPKNTVVSAMFPQANVQIFHSAELAGKFFAQAGRKTAQFSQKLAKRIFALLGGLNNRVRIPSAAAGFIQPASA